MNIETKKGIEELETERVETERVETETAAVEVEQEASKTKNILVCTENNIKVYAKTENEEFARVFLRDYHYVLEKMLNVDKTRHTDNGLMLVGVVNNIINVNGEVCAVVQQWSPKYGNGFDAKIHLKVTDKNRDKIMEAIKTQELCYVTGKINICSLEKRFAKVVTVLNDEFVILRGIKGLSFSSIPDNLLYKTLTSRVELDGVIFNINKIEERNCEGCYRYIFKLRCTEDGLNGKDRSKCLSCFSEMFKEEAVKDREVGAADEIKRDSKDKRDHYADLLREDKQVHVTGRMIVFDGKNKDTGNKFYNYKCQVYGIE